MLPASPPPRHTDQNFLNFMQFFGKLSKKYMLAPPPTEILDPPLAFSHLIMTNDLIWQSPWSMNRNMTCLSVSDCWKTLHVFIFERENPYDQCSKLKIYVVPWSVVDYMSYMLHLQETNLLFFCLKINFLADTRPFMGSLISLFWTSGDVSCEFQSQSGQPYLNFGRGIRDICSLRFNYSTAPFLVFLASTVTGHFPSCLFQHR